MLRTSDERDTFRQSNSGEPLADFIRVQFPKKLGSLPVNVLGRRSGYIPAAHTTADPDKAFCLMTSSMLRRYTYEQHASGRSALSLVLMYFYYMCSISTEREGAKRLLGLPRGWDVTHKDDSESICSMGK